MRADSAAAPASPEASLAFDGATGPAVGLLSSASRGYAGRERWPVPARGVAYGALDLGTNNCRLLIAEPAEPHFRVVDAFSRIVRLGEGLGAAGRLGEGAIERAIEALKVCRAKMDLRGVSRARLIATEACRAATNGEAFVARVERETGLALEVVDRKTEAFLAVSGCASLADPGAHAALVFDIGGGSTEVACLLGPRIGAAADPCERIEDWVSLPVGVVTLAERYGGYDVTPAVYEDMVGEVMDLLAPFRARVGWAARRRGFHLLGTSGTVTTIAGVHLRLPRYDRRRVDGLWMSDRQVDRVVWRLRQAGYPERAANACIGRDRADLVLAGCAILDGLRRSFPSPRLRIADRGLREGILMALMRADGVWRQGRPS
ncbi:Ppx/GppA phosphatase family protein [Chelatococcus reniformis]|uniref:Ppx/GppA phosphatase family protein n=1 Tax=Chelatococcus reniformis TaxID=1494448 RepID=UPI001666E477